MASKNIRFIADMGSNHNQDLERALHLVRAAAHIGCHGIKVQLFKADKLWAPGEPQRETMKSWELPEDFLPAIAQQCAESGILLYGTPFSMEALNTLCAPYVTGLKVGSYEMGWEEFVAAVFRKAMEHGKELHLSYGIFRPYVPKSIDAMRENLRVPVTLYHCNSNYPADADHTSMDALATAHHGKAIRDFEMLTIQQPGEIRLGWSDHTVDPAVIWAAVAAGAKDIEFHLDLDGQGQEYAVGHCWLPDEMEGIIAMCDRVNGMFGWEHVEETPRYLLPFCTDTDGMRPMKSARRIQEGK